MCFGKIFISLNIFERRIQMDKLTKERKSEIEAQANSIREKYSLGTSLDLIEFLTEKLGYEIQLRQINDDTTGMLFINELEKVEQSNSHNVIVINAKLLNDSLFKQKRRFICAHEYGHAVLHKGNSLVFARRDTNEKNSEEEQEAEYFAYCLLLPKDSINMLMTDNSLKSVIEHIKSKRHITTGEIIAELFNVTPKKANARLKQLGY